MLLDTSRTTIWIAAATGIASSAPITPERCADEDGDEPNIPGTWTVRRYTIGERTFFSICSVDVITTMAQMIVSAEKLCRKNHINVNDDRGDRRADEQQVNSADHHGQRRREPDADCQRDVGDSPGQDHADADVPGDVAGHQIGRWPSRRSRSS